MTLIAPFDGLWHVTAPHYCAGLVVRDGVCVEAAPILAWATGKRAGYLGAYFFRKRYRVLVTPIPEVAPCCSNA